MARPRARRRRHRSNPLLAGVSWPWIIGLGAVAVLLFRQSATPAPNALAPIVTNTPGITSTPIMETFDPLQPNYVPLPNTEQLSPEQMAAINALGG